MKITIRAYLTDIWTEDSGTIKIAQFADDGGDVYARFISEDMQKEHTQFNQMFAISKYIKITIEEGVL